MALGRHVDVDKLIGECKDHRAFKHSHDSLELVDIPYASRYDNQQEVPRFRLPQDGVGADVVYQILHDELMLDGNPNMNLASFVHTWVPPQCEKLMMENLNKNLVDQDEYPAAQDIHDRCISMISHLWHSPAGSSIGTATTGSSEAIMLGGLALKKKWQERMKAAGKDIHNPGPNIVMGAEAQVALEKFARYFEVEGRLVPVTKESNYVMDPKKAIQCVDENTIGIFVILGSTYTGVFENVQEMSDLLDDYEKKTGISIPIHVDAASGGFVAPFAYPDYVWDFTIPRVHSINASGHKYGLSTVGVGWIIWRTPDHLPKELIFELHYLGETDYSFNLNFSRPAHPILSQMFNFLNLGFEGYRRVNLNDLAKARILSRALEGTGYFSILSNVHVPKPVAERGNFGDGDAEYYHEGLPVVSFRFTDDFKKQNPNLQQSWIQSQLRYYGWIVPNYPLPPACDDTEILRVVIRESFSGDLLRKLVEDIMSTVENLLKDQGPSFSMSHGAGNGKVKDKHAKWDSKKIKDNHKTHSKVC
ncbi:Glutamate decarboxylase [Vanrija pseudolonga]|uniref:Glutamate decarboxylase n=1 Tax=Vanrija pseudolonga TaxID=143232 RepID=A0AAF0Y1U3_9TREE|nr:Glutamate decarboxylase [Vanrija pseudolonga]